MSNYLIAIKFINFTIDIDPRLSFIVKKIDDLIIIHDKIGGEMKNIILRKIKLEDLDSYYLLNISSKEHHKYNGPYYQKPSNDELKKRIDKIKVELLSEDYQSNSLMIVDSDNNILIGEVSYYWKSKETLWMEIGIVIFNENYWGCGIGYIALKKWINKLFTDKKNITRLGLSTWSGNVRMIGLANKLGFICEATYRKARIVDGTYYDSVSYGILREEWELNYD